MHMLLLRMHSGTELPSTMALTKQPELLEEEAAVPAADRWASTIVGLPFESPHSLRKLCIDQAEMSATQELAVEQQKFKIRLANTEDRRGSASLLIQKMYSWRGYQANTVLEGQPNRITLVAVANEQSIGTLTLGFDSAIGLLVDDLYKPEIDTLRAERRKVCEFTKLAVDERIRSKRVLASLFHIAYVYARKIHQCQDIVIEINPRHVRFYERMLGFQRFGVEKLCERVNAPAVLLRLDLEYARQQIAQFGGKMERAVHEKSLYPYFFSQQDEDGITQRLSRPN